MQRQNTNSPKPPDAQSTDTARKLRRDTTYPERLLWSRLRGGRLCGYKFRRQHPIGGYVADFCCEQAKLVIEVDGMTHVNVGDKDVRRTEALEKQGYHVLRVTNDEVLRDVDTVAEGILLRARQLCGNSQIPSPQPSPEGRGGEGVR